MYVSGTEIKLSHMDRFIVNSMILLNIVSTKFCCHQHRKEYYHPQERNSEKSSEVPLFLESVRFYTSCGILSVNFPAQLR